MEVIMIADSERTLSFRAPSGFAEEIKLFAGDKAISQYIREAVQEKNERLRAERMKSISARLSAKSAAVNKEMDGSMGDGLA